MGSGSESMPVRNNQSQLLLVLLHNVHAKAAALSFGVRQTHLKRLDEWKTYADGWASLYDRYVKIVC